ncbi:MAG TPA: Gfo/Idh/MocA family oxidoreductase [Thermoanaerobaculia bacterium]|jgi:predicted dehydrogenase
MAKVAIIGKGWGSRVQGPAFQEAGLDVIAVAGRDRDWRELIDSGADLISVTAPPSEHAEMAIAALEAGKHVISEKPTALNVAEAERMVAAARAHPNQLALIDHELRFTPSYIAAREEVRGLGGIRYIEMRYCSASRGDRSRGWNWWSDAEQLGGVLGAVGSHFADAVRYLTGEEVVAVQATLETVIKERSGHEVTSDDFSVVNLRLSGGAVALMSLSAIASGSDEPSTITIYGENAALRLVNEELLRNGTRIAGHDLVKRPGNSTGGAFGSGTLHLARALKRALDDGDRAALAPAATFEDGLAQQRVLDAARASHAGGGAWITI